MTKTSDITIDTVETKKSAKKKLKRSKSESTHNRKSRTTTAPNLDSTAAIGKETKPSRRRFFSRKLKKQVALEGEVPHSDSLQQQSVEIVDEKSRKPPQKSHSFNERARPLSPPPDYEESTGHEITPLPITTVSWKPENQLYSTKLNADVIDSELGDDAQDFYEEEEQMSVPLLVTVFVIPLYLTLGALLFRSWENWSFLNSFYFCFITLTTIGFGDFVPGTSLTATAAKEKLIAAALYILLGLVLIAMCFNLMKEQLTQKFKQVAGKWGIVEY